MGTRILLDMDGVLADFIGAACLHHERESPYNTPENMGKWDIDKLWGMSSDTFWRPLKGKYFWANLKQTPEADSIVGNAYRIAGINNVAICTRPPDEDYGPAVDGKRAWIKRYYPELLNKMVFCVDKAILASRGTLLVDDSDHNVERFTGMGGVSLLIPRPWNSSYSVSDINTESYIRGIMQYKWGFTL